MWSFSALDYSLKLVPSKQYSKVLKWHLFGTLQEIHSYGQVFTKHTSTLGTNQHLLTIAADTPWTEQDMSPLPSETDTGQSLETSVQGSVRS